MYEYLRDPSSLSSEWKKYFDSIQNGQIDVSHEPLKINLKIQHSKQRKKITQIIQLQKPQMFKI